MKIDIYPKDLLAVISSSDKYIPRQMDYKDIPTLYHKFWIEDLHGLFKLTAIAEYFKVYYYFFEGKETNQLYTNPLNSSKFYEMMLNNYNILDKDIVNDNNVYRGYEIKYWFFKKWCKKYYDFERYLKMNTDITLNDNKKYLVNAVLVNGLYMNCKITNAPRN